MMLMIGAARKDAILRLVDERDGVSIAELTQLLGVSTATVRRDLDDLAEAGRVARVRGGAQRRERAELDPHPLATVAQMHAAGKKAVGRAAADFVVDGSTILMDIGTTTAQMAESLLDLSITVVTTSIDLVRRLEPGENIDIVVAGGLLRRTYQSLVGAVTLDALSKVRVDTCFLSTSGISPAGHVLDNTGMEHPVKKAMIAAADRVVLLADGSKLPGQGLLSVCTPDQIDVLVTTKDAAPEILRIFEKAGTQVVVAD